MQYAGLKRRGLPIGSGHVEAANKTHVEERMKRSGMRWSMAWRSWSVALRVLGSSTPSKKWVKSCTALPQIIVFIDRIAENTTSSN